MRSTAKREEEAAAAASKGSGSNKPHKQKGQRTFLTKKNGIKTQKHEKLSTTKTMRERERKKRRERARASHLAANERKRREESAKKVRRESDQSKRAAQQAVKFKRARESGRECRAKRASRRVQLEIKCQNLCDVHFVKYFYENNLRKMYF